MKLLVIGAGAAGTAAAWRASRRAEVTVAHDRAGATALYCGAVDDRIWGESEPTHPLDADSAAFVTALGCWTFGAKPSRFATSTGQLRAAWGGDTALLDLAPLAGKRIGVTDLGRPQFSATELAWALSRTPWAERTGATFVPVIEPLRASAINDYDFAAAHDEPNAVHALGDRLARAGAEVSAWLLPPALGVRGSARQLLEDRLAIPVGECMGMPGGPSGARFEVCRDELFAARGVTLKSARVVSLAAQADRVQVELVEPSGARLEHTCDRVVLALGGVVAGGIRLGQPRRDAASSSAFELGIEPQILLRAGEHDIDRAASLHGADLTHAGLDVLERIGLAAPSGRVAELPGVFAAGDVIADKPRTLLEAVRSGCRAADLALASAGASFASRSMV